MAQSSGLPQDESLAGNIAPSDSGKTFFHGDQFDPVDDENGRFITTSEADPHLARAKRILAAHPDLKKSYGRDPSSAAWTLAIVAFQVLISIALALSGAPWWLVIVFAYCIGAFANIALLILIHEYTHNLVFRGTVLNRLGALFANVPIIFPAAMGFRNFHLQHHRYMGVQELDGDLPSEAEARWVGNSTLRKLLWVAMFWFVQGVMRPAKTTGQRTFDGWAIVNVMLMAACVGALVVPFGAVPVCYLFLSTMFALGPHPVGGRWFQEHYVLTPGQETYSYYGPLNRISFNVGYHNEHHDFPGIPWSRLPAVRATAREFYDPLHHYTSWTGLLLRIVLDPRFRPHLRIVRRLAPRAAK